MSRIGKKPVPILDGVKVAVAGTQIIVEGPKGKLALGASAGSRGARRRSRTPGGRGSGCTKTGSPAPFTD